MPNNLRSYLKPTSSNNLCHKCGNEGVIERIEISPKSAVGWILLLLFAAFFLQGAISYLNGNGRLGNPGNAFAAFLCSAIGIYLIFPKYLTQCTQCNATHGFNSYLTHLGFGPKKSPEKIHVPDQVIDNGGQESKFGKENDHTKHVAKDIGKGLGIVAILLILIFLYMMFTMMWYFSNP